MNPADSTHARYMGSMLRARIRGVSVPYVISSYRGRLSWLIAAALLTIFQPAAATAAETSADDILAAIVGVTAKVPADARTAAHLGTDREGSGVVIDDHGLVLTIGYLILEASEVSIVTAEDGRTVPADIIAYDHETGFGLLRAARPLDVTPMALGRSADLEVRDPVLIASHGGAAMARPALVVSRRLFAGYWEYILDKAIFTSPPHPGFGGAALIGGDGRLLGIGSLIVGDAATEPQQLAGNMFVPIDSLKPILAELLEAGRTSRPSRPWLGVYAEEVRGRIFVVRIAEDGPAQKSGILRGDIIVAVGDTPVRDLAGFYREIWARGDAGIEVDLTVLQGSELRRVRVRSGDRYSWLRLGPQY